MRTHTVRNKGSRTPLVTFVPEFFQELKEADPEAVSLTLEWFANRYRSLTGKTFRLDFSQEQELQRLVDPDGKGSWSSRFSKVTLEEHHVLTTFRDGFLSRDCGWGLREAFRVASRFYQLADGVLSDSGVR